MSYFNDDFKKEQSSKNFSFKTSKSQVHFFGSNKDNKLESSSSCFFFHTKNQF